MLPTTFPTAPGRTSDANLQGGFAEWRTPDLPIEQASATDPGS